MFKKEKQPARLEKKQEVSRINCFKFIIKQPEFWLFIVIIMLFIALTFVAMKEALSSLFYNGGINSTVAIL